MKTVTIGKIAIISLLHSFKYLIFAHYERDILLIWLICFMKTNNLGLLSTYATNERNKKNSINHEGNEYSNIPLCNLDIMGPPIIISYTENNSGGNNSRY